MKKVYRKERELSPARRNFLLRTPKVSNRDGRIPGHADLGKTEQLVAEMR
jgi:hypothetical protein